MKPSMWTDALPVLDQPWRCQDVLCKGYDEPLVMTFYPVRGWQFKHGGWIWFLDIQDVMYREFNENTRVICNWLIDIHEGRLDFVGGPKYPEQEAMRRVLSICGING